tara:strand:+ start:3301 stop:3927 length:627 start_codon:yes stop_codon:yes gene_type:complete
VPEIKIPAINLPDIEIPETPYFTQHKLEGQIPGCNLFHRDLQITRNPSLLIADPNGTFTTCPEGQIPSFDPIRFDMNELIYTESNPVQNEAKQQEKISIPPPVKKKKKIEIPPCPGKKDLRVGSFVNEKRLERVSGHKRGEDGIECITLYEDVPFKDQYIPTLPTVISTAAIATVAATTPLLLNLVKPLVKNLIKKITTRKSKNESEG